MAKRIKLIITTTNYDKRLSERSLLQKTLVHHDLVFVIKGHPFTDGNKHIGSFMFLLYLKSQSMPIKLNENGLVALALLVAESDPE